MSESSFTIGMVGLGRMGANMSRRMARAGIRVFGFDASDEARNALAEEAGVQCFATLSEMVAALPAATAGKNARLIWVMLPAGEITDTTLEMLWQQLAAGDLIVEGGNSNYQDSQRRAARSREQGIEFLDCGVSGGVWGLANGYCLSLGGAPEAVERVRVFADALAPGGADGWMHCGPSGAGHFVKMIHNGIEYGMMQAIAEGFALLEGQGQMNIDLGGVAKLWQQGSVIRSWLLDLTADALAEPGALGAVAPFVSDSGEGRWTIDEAIRQGTPAPVIALALMSRFDSQGRADTANRLLALMRQGFGGHAIKKEQL
jgi:6-phosphogluconate dehydrogenase